MVSGPDVTSQGVNELNILLVEDNPADIRLIKEFLKETKLKNILHIVHDGIEATEFLYVHCKHEKNKHCPHIVILDLNLPKKSGCDVLKEIKNDEYLKRIPVIIFTTSSREEDINECYKNYANCYIIKPVDFNEFNKVMDSIKEFWLNIVKLPRK